MNSLSKQYLQHRTTSRDRTVHQGNRSMLPRREPVDRSRQAAIIIKMIYDLKMRQQEVLDYWRIRGWNEDDVKDVIFFRTQG